MHKLYICYTDADCEWWSGEDMKVVMAYIKKLSQ
jgi:hypothetical protein